MSESTKVWVHGLGAALIVGCVTALYAHFQSPNMNLNDIILIAIGGACLYLKQSPLPNLNQEDKK